MLLFQHVFISVDFSRGCDLENLTLFSQSGQFAMRLCLIAGKTREANEEEETNWSGKNVLCFSKGTRLFMQLWQKRLYFIGALLLNVGIFRHLSIFSTHLHKIHRKLNSIVKLTIVKRYDVLIDNLLDSSQSLSKSTRSMLTVHPLYAKCKLVTRVIFVVVAVLMSKWRNGFLHNYSVVYRWQLCR